MNQPSVLVADLEIAMAEERKLRAQAGVILAALESDLDAIDADPRRAGDDAVGFARTMGRIIEAARTIGRRLDRASRQSARAAGALLKDLREAENAAKGGAA